MAATRGIGTHMVEVDVHALQLEVGGTGEANKISDRHSFSTPISSRRREKSKLTGHRHRGRARQQWFAWNSVSIFMVWPNN